LAIPGALGGSDGQPEQEEEPSTDSAEAADSTAEADEVTDAQGESDRPADDEAWVPPPHAVPFGPFLSLGALQMLFLGDWLMAWASRVMGIS
jgi:hypothetical protein